MTHITIEKAKLELVLEAITKYLSECPDPSEEAVEGLCDAASTARRALAAPVQEPVGGLHAVYFRNNWDGEGDLEYLLAYFSEKGEWTLHENGAPLIEFNGDEIIKTWPLTFESATPPAQPAPVQEPTCKQSLQVWVISNGKGAGQFSWDPQDERFWTRMEPEAQRQWVGLTEDEVASFQKVNCVYPGTTRAIEAKLKEKNT
jgi:hypothetical protein